MSNLLIASQVSDSADCLHLAAKVNSQIINTREAQVGGVTIRRALPGKERRLIGAWCFLDHFGPVVAGADTLNVAPHPHCGLQTFTYLLAGEILHRDSLGSVQPIEPGQVNLMTAGQGIAHSEQASPHKNLHGVQLWIALPNSQRNMQPAFHHYSKVPVIAEQDVTIKVLAGEYLAESSPVNVYSPLTGLHIHSKHSKAIALPLKAEFEYGIIVLQGSLQLKDQTITPGKLLYLPPGHEQLPLHFAADTHVFLVGGIPFTEEVLLWWNFVARTKGEISQATQDWREGKRFGQVSGYPGERLNAPDIPW